jgi:chitodextrinase
MIQFAGRGRILARPTVTKSVNDFVAAEAGTSVGFVTSPVGAQYSYTAGTTTFSPTNAKKTPPNTAITFTANVTVPPDVTIEEYHWDFGDGHTDVGPVVVHTYTHEDEHTQAVLRITDSRHRRWFGRKTMYVVS